MTDPATGKTGDTGVPGQTGGAAGAFRLHHVPLSRSFRILWLAEELGLEIDLVTYKIGDRSMREGGLDQLSPATRVPAIEIDGQVIAESGAIVQWLCERTEHIHAGLNRNSSDPDRAAYLQWIGFSETMASLIEQLNLNHVFLRPPAKPAPIVIKINTARLKQTVSGMEARLGDGYLLESGFSGADVMMGFNLMAVPYFVSLDPFPKVSAYRERIMARPAYQRAFARDGAVPFYDRDFYEIPEA